MLDTKALEILKDAIKAEIEDFNHYKHMAEKLENEELASRLRAMGARRVQKGGGYYWILKPDLKPGEDIDL